MEKIQKLIFLSGGSLIVSLFILELILRYVHYPQYGCERIEDVSENSIARFDPILGWRYKPSLSTKGEYDIVYTFSQEGYRTEDIDIKTNFDKPRILIVGDSFLFGHGIPFTETFGFKLDKRLNHEYEVLNFAVQAYGTDQIFISLQELLPQYTPSIVIMDIGNEQYLRNTSRDRREFIKCARFLGTKPLYRLVNDKLTLISKPELYASYDNPRLLLLIRKALEKPLPLRLEEGKKITNVLLRDIKNYVEANGAQLYLINVADNTSPAVETNILGATINFEEATGSGFYISESDHHPNAAGIDFMLEQFMTVFVQ